MDTIELKQTQSGPPPKAAVGVTVWLKQNLFSSWFNTLLTIIFGALTFYIVFGTLKWALFSANWEVVALNFKLLMAGQYPAAQLWRVWACLTLFSLLLGMSWGAWKGTMAHIAYAFTAIYLVMVAMPFISGESRVWLMANIVLMVVGFVITKQSLLKKSIIYTGWFLLFPITIFMLNGFGVMTSVGTNLWGGFLLTILLASSAIVISFPIGILLALGRRSKLPTIKYFCIGYIEFVRGVPLITVLFIAQIMLPLFLGQGMDLNNVLRAMVGLTLFSAAFCAEYVRGGLQTLPRGQYEASHALGLNSTIMTVFIILPQALRAIIPALVGMFIGILKDTSLVMIVGLIDLFGMAKNVIQNPAFVGMHKEVYMFVALVFFVTCYILSHISLRIEKALGVGKR